MNRIYHVNQAIGCDSFSGSEEKPFATISQGAKVAMPGDTVLVHAGEYREWVKPENSGTSELTRIVYEAAEGEKVVIKGSERIQNWELLEGNVWKAVLPNMMFGDFNPYKEILAGDWLLYPDCYTKPYEEKGILKNFPLHLGEVYMNGKSFYEAGRLSDLKNPVVRREGVNPPWTEIPEFLLNPEDSVYQWYAEVLEDEGKTIIYANFQGKNPNKELVEVNVRKCCFYPVRTRRNYITVRGFEMAHAATPWAPPTADQPGLLGVNWSKGWIIERNHIHDAKCSAISIGKEESTGHNMCMRTQRKPGYQYQMEAVFRAKRNGWNKGTIGNHIIRNNVIYDCGQNGIVGHMGCIFSRIEKNHIYNIAVKHEYFGYEIAGIKLHAPIDVQVLHNNIHHTTLGVWFDWQAQGIRVSGNLFYENNRDFMIEVTHGPYVVDNNIFGSRYNFDNVAQGGAYIHNLCCGIIRCVDCRDRSTPYHFAHTTDVAGTAMVYGGDDRVYQNIFVGGPKIMSQELKYGTEGYEGHPESWEKYLDIIISKGNGDHDKFQETPEAVYINGNVYLKGAIAYSLEKQNFLSDSDPNVKFVEMQEGTYLEMELEEGALKLSMECITTGMLGMPRITEVPYDDSEGRDIIFNKDYLGNERNDNPIAGPLEVLKPGYNRICVWKV